jgi:hypothetical protein
VDLQILSQRTGIPVRRLRYCLDHNLVPGLDIEISANEAGRPRKFHEDVGFGIACAAVLVEAGFGRTTARNFLEGLLQIKLPGQGGLALVAVLTSSVAARAELGDGVNVRLICPDLGHDGRWSCPGNPAPLDSSYVPTTYIGLDLGRIRDVVFGRA